MELKSGWTGGLARAAAQRPWRFLGVWVLLLVGAFFLAGSLNTTDGGGVEDTEARRAIAFIEQLRGDQELTEEEFIVVEADASVDDATFAALVASIVDGVREVEVVSSAVSYLDGVEDLRTADGRVAMIPITTTLTESDDIDLGLADPRCRRGSERNFWLPRDLDRLVQLRRHLRGTRRRDLRQGRADRPRRSGCHPAAGLRRRRSRAATNPAGTGRGLHRRRRCRRHQPGLRGQHLHHHRADDGRPGRRHRLFTLHRPALPRRAGPRIQQARRHRDRRFDRQSHRALLRNHCRHCTRPAC